MTTVIRLKGRNGETEKVIGTAFNFRVIGKNGRITPSLRATMLGNIEADPEHFAVAEVTFGAHIEGFLPKKRGTAGNSRISGWIDDASQHITLRVKDSRRPIVYRRRRYQEATLFERD